MVGSSKLVALSVVGGEVILFPEVLPAITGHHAEIVLAKLLVVVGESIEEVVALILCAAFGKTCTVLLVAGVHHTSQLGHVAVVLAAEHIVAEVYVEFQVFKTVNLVHDSCATNGACNLVLAVGEIESSHRVIGLDSHRRTAVGPDEVSETRVGSSGAASCHNGAGRVVAECAVHNIIINLAVLLIGNLEVDVGSEVLVEELRSDVATERVALVVARLDDTILVGIAKRNAIGTIYSLDIAGYREVLLGAERGAIDFVLPVGVCIAEFSIRGDTGHCGDILAELVGSEHVELLGNRTHGIVATISDLSAVATLLGGDNDYTIRCTRTVDCSSRSIFEHGESLDVLRVDRADDVACALDSRVIHRHTVDNDKRVVACREAGAATNAYCSALARSSGARHHVYTCHLTHESVLSRHAVTLVKLIGLDSHH